MTLNARCYAAVLVVLVSIGINSAFASPKSEALSREGLRLLQVGEKEAAVRTLIEATNVDPKDGQAFFYLGVALNRFGQPYPAMTALRRAVSLDAIHRDIRLEAGWAALETGRYSAAVSFLEAFRTKNPDHAKAHEFLGRAYIQLGQLGKAEAMLQRAVDIDPSLEPTTTFFLGQIAARRGDLETAAASLNYVQNIDPDNPVGRTLRDIRRQNTPPQPLKPWAVIGQTYIGSNSNVISLSEDIVRPADITNTKSNYFGVFAGGQYEAKINTTNSIVFGGTLGHRDYRDISGQDTKTATAFGTYKRIIAPRVRSLVTASFSHARVNGESFLNAFTLNPSVQFRVNRLLQIEAGYSATRLNYPEPTATPASLDRDSTLQSYGARVIMGFPSLDSEFEIGAQRLHNGAKGGDYDYRGTAISVGVRTQLPWKLESSVRLQRTSYDYVNLNSLALTTTAPLSGFGATRQDSLDQITLRLQRPVYDHITAYFQFTRSNANSNIPVFNYKQRDAQIGLTARF